MARAGAPKGVPLDLDSVRRQKMADIEAITGRPLVLYAVDMLNFGKAASNPLLILLNLSDKDGFVEATRAVSGDRIDVVLQSPGGLAEAVESIVAILRDRFKHIRFIVPSIAKSAATMLALSGDMIVGGAATELGPIDPQMPTGRGGFVPAQTILDQHNDAIKALKADPGAMPAWLPILQQFAPSLLQECRNRQALSEKLVSTWLEAYMFAGDADAHDHAVNVAAALNDHNRWLAHGRRVGLDWLAGKEARVKVLDLRTDPKLEAAVWGLHLAVSITFSSSNAFKIVENTRGDAVIGLSQQVSFQLLSQPPQPPPAPPPPRAPTGPQPGPGAPSGPAPPPAAPARRPSGIVR